jgi:hypothetical protein
MPAPTHLCRLLLSALQLHAHSWGCLFQKDPSLFDETETPEGRPEAERAAFIEELHLKTRFHGGAAYEASRSERQKASFRVRRSDQNHASEAAHALLRK